MLILEAWGIYNMALIGFIALISLISFYIGVIGIIVTSSLSIWVKIIILSVLAFVTVVILAGLKEKKKECD